MAKQVPTSKILKTLTGMFQTVSPKNLPIEQIPTYTPDWDNLSNEGFLNNARQYGVKCLVSADVTRECNVVGKGLTTERTTTDAIDFSDKNGNWEFAMLQNKTDYTDRLRAAVAFAKDWIANQPEKFEEPRLIELPSIKKSVLWLSGSQNVFILVNEWGTKPSDPFQVDSNYLARVRKEHAEMLKACKAAETNRRPGYGPPGD